MDLKKKKDKKKEDRIKRIRKLQDQVNYLMLKIEKLEKQKTKN